MLRFFNLANLVSFTGLAAAVVSLCLSASGFLAHAIVALVVSGLCDLFDGFVARRVALSEEARRFGFHVDSLIDACSFGMAPAALLYAAGLRTIPEVLVIIVFVFAVVWRLAYFNTVGMTTEGATRYFTGLPTTYVALVLPLVFLTGFANALTLRVAAISAALLLAAAMVSTRKVPKPGGVWYAIFFGVAIVVTTTYLIFAPHFARD